MSPMVRAALKGLILTVASGATSALAAGLVMPAIDPDHFNFGEGLLHLIEAGALMVFVGGVQHGAAYLARWAEKAAVAADPEAK